MKNSILKYFSLLLLVVLALGCGKDFLDLNPPASDNAGAFYSTLAQADQAITACYSQFNNVEAWDRNLLMGFGDIASDDAEAGGDYVNEVVEFENFNRLISNSTDVMFDATYGTLYKAISFCNIALERCPSIETNTAAEKTQLDIRLGEAKFIRAINYFYLTLVFGEVPLVDHILGPSEYQLSRSPLKDIYNFIEQDLKEAIAVLPEKGSEGYDPARATKGSAQALLARMCLYESSYARYYAGSDPRFAGMTERWADALTYAEAVINSGKYQLVGIDGHKYVSWRSPSTNGFRYIFTSDGDLCDENVFEINCIQEGLGYDVARGNAMAQWQTARYYYNSNWVSTGSDRWGLNLPHPGLKAEFETGDPRLETTMTWEYKYDSVLIGSIWMPSNDSFMIGNSVWVPMSFTNSVTKTYARKYECSAAEYWDDYQNWNCAPNNVKLIRYSDAYLIAAEAALALSQNDKALDYVNKVRERARMCGTTGVPAALTSVDLAAIKHERRCEFALEGQRYFDLVRWNDAFDILNGPNWDGYIKVYARGKNEFQPLPEREISLSGGKLQQYTAF